MKKKHISLFFLFIFLFSYLTLSNELSVMIYFAGNEHNMELGQNQLEFLQKAGNLSDAKFSYYFDDWSGYTWKYMGDGPPVRVQKAIENDNSSLKPGLYINSGSGLNFTPTASLETNAGRGKNLETFLSKSMESFNAAKNILIISGTGSGMDDVDWVTASAEYISGHQINTYMMKTVAKFAETSNKKIDAVVFDSGFVLDIEAAYDASNSGVRTILGLEENYAWTGFPYSQFLVSLFTNESMDVQENIKQASAEIFKSYRGVTDSRVMLFNLNTEDMDKIAEGLAEFSTNAASNPANAALLHESVNNTFRYFSQDYAVDMPELLQRIGQSSSSGAGSASSLLETLSNSSIILIDGFTNDKDTRPNYSGIAINFPVYRPAEGDSKGTPFINNPFNSNMRVRYERSRFYEKTRWSEMLESYYSHIQKM
ncbi:MAG: clostripain-related cysteine peptidase [Candidatus Muiribacteriota bacterium]